MILEEAAWQAQAFTGLSLTSMRESLYWHCWVSIRLFQIILWKEAENGVREDLFLGDSHFSAVNLAATLVSEKKYWIFIDFVQQLEVQAQTNHCEGYSLQTTFDGFVV